MAKRGGHKYSSRTRHTYHSFPFKTHTRYTYHYKKHGGGGGRGDAIIAIGLLAVIGFVGVVLAARGGVQKPGGFYIYPPPPPTQEELEHPERPHPMLM